jgi:glycosyltransferase involved in cell wall biosynthesis
MTNQKKLKVLVYGDIGGSGGYVSYCKGLFGSGVTPKDLEIIFVCSTSFYEQIKPLDDGIKVVHHSWLSSPSRFYRYLWHLVIYPNIVRANSPDVEFYPSGQLRILFRRACTVTSSLNLLLFDPLELARMGMGDKQKQKNLEIYRDHQSRSFHQASGVIFCSEYSRNVISRLIPSIRSSCVVPLGVEPDFCIGPKTSLANSLQTNLLYVSPLLPYKHHQEVIQAIKTLRKELNKDLQLRLVGNGSAEANEKLETYISSEGASTYVNLIGFVDDNSLVELYRKADMFIFASSCEAFPIILVEAMRAHLPIACSELVGLPDILKDAGEYFDPRDPHSIANALRKLILNKESRKYLGEKAYDYSLKFTWERSAQQTFSFIRQISGQY